MDIACAIVDQIKKWAAAISHPNSSLARPSISLDIPRLRAVPLHSGGLLPQQLVVNTPQLHARGCEDLTNALGFNKILS